MSARRQVLDRVRAAVAKRERTEHPGRFESRGPSAAEAVPVEVLASMLDAAGAEVVHVEGTGGAGKWIRRFANEFESVTIGATVPPELRPMTTTRGSHEAALGVSMARAAAAETGSLLMDARDGRRTQLLVPTHVVFVRAADVHPTLRDALTSVGGDLPSAIGLHSGPSKSADIAQTLVTGVHGPGRLVAVVIA